MVVGTVEITTDEYKKLVLKADKYDRLRARCVAGAFATMQEEILYDITEKEQKAMEERRKQ